MTLTLAQATSRVRRYLDDNNTGTDARWTDSEIQDSLKLAGNQIMTEAAGLSLDMFKLTSQFTVSTDTLTLNPAPTKICDVTIISGAARLRVMPGNPKTTVFNSGGLGGRTAEISYIPIYVQPTLAADPIVYGTGLTFDNSIVDSYLCALAARDCKVIEGDVNQQLEMQLQQLKQSFRSLANNPSISIPHAYGKQYRTGYSWYQTSPTTLKLVI